MKNLKRILSFFIVMGFMFVMFGFKVGVKATASTVTYTVTGITTVSETGDTGNILIGTYVQTYEDTVSQLTKNNSATLTVSGLNGKKVNKITLSMHSNAKAGQAALTVTAGTTPILSIAAATFSSATWNGSWSQEYVDIEKIPTTEYTIQEDEDLVIVLTAATSSIYIQSFKIEFEEGSQEPAVILNAPANINLMVGNALQLTSSAQNVGEISTDVWTSSNTSAATVSSTGLVAPVALGTTNITRTVNGTASNAISLKIWPSNASNISVATALAIAEFTGSTNSYFTYSSSGTVSEIIDADNFLLFDGNDSITIYKTGHGFKSNDPVVVTGKLKKYNTTLEYSNPTVTGYTVTFDTAGGTPSYDTITGLASGAKISNPGTPTKSGYTFTGWFNGNNEWDFENNTITSSITLTAKWASDAAQTSINNKLESINAYMSLAYGYTLNKIDNPSSYTKVTSVSHLSDGDSVIVVFTKQSDPTSTIALNTSITSNKTTGTAVTISNDTITAGIEDSCCWTLVRNNDGTWKLKNGTQFLNLGESSMSFSPSGSNFDLHISNTQSYFTVTVNDKVRTILYRDTYDIRNYSPSNIGADGYSTVNLYVKQANAKYSFRDVDFRIRCAIDEGIAELNEDYAVTFGIEVSAGGNTVKYANNSGASFQTAGGKQFVTLDLGDMLNTNYANLDTEFTVRAYVEYQGAYFYSTNTKTYSVKGMVDYYYNNQHIDAVSGLKEILENYGYTFE